MIFYFSGTGNTRWVAQQIAETIGEELLYIPDLIREGRYTFTLQKEERIGFCFPTHGWQPPRIVRDFIQRLQVVDSDAFCWVLTTCGDNMGECMTILNKELRTIGLGAETLFAVIMPESYVCLPFMHTDPKDKELWKIENARHQLSHIIPIIRDCKRGIEELEKGATPRLYSYVIGGYFNKHMITDRKFMVDEDVCIRCGKCMHACPMGLEPYLFSALVKNNRIEEAKEHNILDCIECGCCFFSCPANKPLTDEIRLGKNKVRAMMAAKK